MPNETEQLDQIVGELFPRLFSGYLKATPTPIQDTTLQNKLAILQQYHEHLIGLKNKNTRDHGQLQLYAIDKERQTIFQQLKQKKWVEGVADADAMSALKGLTEQALQTNNDHQNTLTTFFQIFSLYFIAIQLDDAQLDSATKQGLRTQFDDAANKQQFYTEQSTDLAQQRSYVSPSAWLHWARDRSSFGQDIAKKQLQIEYIQLMLKQFELTQSSVVVTISTTRPEIPVDVCTLLSLSVDEANSILDKDLYVAMSQKIECLQEQITADVQKLILLQSLEMLNQQSQAIYEKIPNIKQPNDAQAGELKKVILQPQQLDDLQTDLEACAACQSAIKNRLCVEEPRHPTMRRRRLTSSLVSIDDGPVGFVS